MNILIARLVNAPTTAQYRATTTGMLYLDANDEGLCRTLEPTEPMIPVGVYSVRLQYSERFERKTPWLTVPGRTAIELHGGNVATDSEGCILVAMNKLSDYEIDDTPPATTAIENELALAEANGEVNTVTVKSLA